MTKDEERELEDAVAEATDSPEIKTYRAAADRAQKALADGRLEDAQRAFDEADSAHGRVKERLEKLKPQALGVLDRTLIQNRYAISTYPGDGIDETDLNVALSRSRSVREKLTSVAADFAPQIKELDSQIDRLVSLLPEPTEVGAGASKMRVLDEKRLARDPHSQVRERPLRDLLGLGAVADEADAANELEAKAMNEAARDVIRNITGQPLIKAIEEVLDASFPGLVKALYPRVYENVGRYCSPRNCAVMIANAIAESLRYGAHRTPTAYRLLMPGLSYLRERRMPMFFVAPDLLEAVLRTDFDDDINWTELELPYETGILMLPKGALVHPTDGEVSMLIWSRVAKGPHKAPWLGLPQPDVSQDCFVILGACVDKMIWYDSILTANVRPTLRLKNLFYREPGQPIPSVTKTTLLDHDLDEQDSEFVEKMGVVVFGTIMAMNARPTLVERGQRLKVVGKGDTAREFWSPNVIGARYKIKREVAKIVDRKFVVPQREHGTHASPRLHWRRGHYRQQPVGPGRKERKQIWIEPCLIGAE